MFKLLLQYITFLDSNILNFFETCIAASNVVPLKAGQKPSFIFGFCQFQSKSLLKKNVIRAGKGYYIYKTRQSVGDAEMK